MWQKEFCRHNSGYGPENRELILYHLGLVNQIAWTLKEEMFLWLEMGESWQKEKPERFWVSEYLEDWTFLPWDGGGQVQVEMEKSFEKLRAVPRNIQQGNRHPSLTVLQQEPEFCPTKPKSRFFQWFLLRTLWPAHEFQPWKPRVETSPNIQPKHLAFRTGIWQMIHCFKALNFW